MPQLQKRIHLNLQTTVQRALGFSWAVRASLVSQQQLVEDEINEVEEYLGLLRAKKATIKLHVGEADQQIGIIREVMNDHGISDISASHSNEDLAPDDYPLPPPSPPIPKTSYSQYSNDTTSEDPAAITEESITSKRQQIMDELMGDSLI